MKKVYENILTKTVTDDEEIKIFETVIGKFYTEKIERDINGNARIKITPFPHIEENGKTQWINKELPPVAGFRRNNKKGYYITQCANIEEEEINFLVSEIKKGNKKLYENG